MAFLVATTSLPVVYRLNGYDWEKVAAEEKMEKKTEKSGHYIIASSRPPERRPLERRTLVPISLATKP